MKEKIESKVKAALNGRPVFADDHACVGEHNWQVLTRTPYVFEPLAQECYVTTAALRGSDVNTAKEMLGGGVVILDLDRNVKEWMGISGVLNGTYTSEVELTLRLFPDENKDTIRRLTKVLNVKCRVVKSEVPALVVGRNQGARAFARTQSRTTRIRLGWQHRP